MRIRWDELRARRKEQLVDLMERGELRRIPRTRPRASGEEQVLSLLVRLRWKRWVESRTVVILSPRRWGLRLDKGDNIAGR